MGIKHKFQSAKSNSGDTSLIRPIDWNEPHTNFVPEIVQMKHNGTQVSTITLDSTPVSGNTLLLSLDGYNVAQASAVSSTNTTWTQMATVNSDGGAKIAIWAGLASGSAGTVITVTHSNGFMSMSVVELTDILTPTAGTTATLTAIPTGPTTQFLKLSSVSEGHLIAITGPVENTVVFNRVHASVPYSGLPYAICPLIVCYSQGYPLFVTSESNAAGIIAVEIT